MINGKATTDPLFLMNPSINGNYDPQNLQYIQEEDKRNGKQRIQYGKQLS
jgi:hypothetical protein